MPAFCQPKQSHELCLQVAYALSKFAQAQELTSHEREVLNSDVAEEELFRYIRCHFLTAIVNPKFCEPDFEFFSDERPTHELVQSLGAFAIRSYDVNSCDRLFSDHVARTIRIGLFYILDHDGELPSSKVELDQYFESRCESLPSDLREVFQCRYEHAMWFIQIADSMKLEPAEVKSRCNVALSYIQDEKTGEKRADRSTESTAMGSSSEVKKISPFGQPGDVPLPRARRLFALVSLQARVPTPLDPPQVEVAERSIEARRNDTLDPTLAHVLGVLSTTIRACTNISSESRRSKFPKEQREALPLALLAAIDECEATLAASIEDLTSKGILSSEAHAFIKECFREIRQTPLAVEALSSVLAKVIIPLVDLRMNFPLTSVESSSESF